MTRVANMPREYRSPLRDELAEATRGRILDAAVRVMAAGLATLSMPAVAREAGVSVPTVYRHFGSKPDLLDAIYPHVVRRAGLDELAFPETLDGLRDGIRSVFNQLDALDDLTRASMASPASQEVRRRSMPRRVALARRLIESIEPPLSSRDRDRLTRLLTLLVNSSALRLWRDHLGASVDQAADDIEWVMGAAIAAARREVDR